MAEASRFRGHTHQNNVRCAKRPRRYYRVAWNHGVLEHTSRKQGAHCHLDIAPEGFQSLGGGICFQGESKRVERKKKSRAHEPFDSCALFQLSRKVFMLPGSICRENIPAPFSWQEVSPSFSVETCVGLCKSRYAEAFHRLPALRWRGLFFRSDKKIEGA